jgi:hypothetical protein
MALRLDATYSLDVSSRRITSFAALRRCCSYRGILKAIENIERMLGPSRYTARALLTS